MLVSIIIPNYNHAAFLTQRIESILNQTYQNFEIILLDDASKDDSVDNIERYKGHPKISKVLFNSQNSGSTFKQWQKGISLAQGKYIWIAESDDYADPEFLKRMLPLFESNEMDIGLAYCKSLPVDQNGVVYDESDWWMKRVDPIKWEKDFFNKGEKEVAEFLSVQCTIPNASAVLFDKRCFSQIKWEDVDYKICGDWHIYVSVLKKFDIAYCSSPLNYQRNHNLNARSRFTNRLLLEQIKTLSHIHKNFSVTKSIAYNKALDERLALLMAAVKNNAMSKKTFISTILLIRKFDHGFLSRFIRVFYGKLRGKNFNFS
ncbi:glycosyltransferase family 2 protein [Mucilaginibacter achroorhodeus]|uniref:Glycosyltransferase family 2 protein n=1 Tax=Mucilaginibacter achroorhodeus TaxID=2599294 RepID=A0A563U189_9SPHI|nr:glycosyltransferase family 2 protein [Mucilaginibacter achroorhodeus]TWR25377.1 glycosyltransferase family 2 protein [Mucilaginibacter achroorhodeus]